MKNYILILGLLTLLVTSCVDGESVLPNSSGKANEMLLVIDDGLFDSKTGQKINDLFTQDVAGLAWNEPFFDVSRLNHRNYSEMFRIARNVVYVDVSNKYTSGKVKLYKNLHASNQSFVQIQAPTMASLDSLIDRQGNRILSYLYTSERKRAIKYFTKFESKSIMDSIESSMGIRMLIPTSFNRQKFREDFIWMVSGNIDKRLYLAIYKYDYVDDSTFTMNYLLKKRDELMKKNIPGSYEGSYMKTSYTFMPEFKSYERKGKYIAEIRGLWETEGDMMGGPFLSQTILDEENQQIITVEGFVYAPHKEKRNLIRQLEAMLYTLKLSKKGIADNNTTSK